MLRGGLAPAPGLPLAEWLFLCMKDVEVLLERFLSPRVRLESVVGAKKITASRRCRQLASLRQKTSAIMPSPTALKCCPQVSASH